MNFQNEKIETEIVFTGRPADIVIERLRSIPDLLHCLEDVDPRYLTPVQLAQSLTFFQVAAFGESGRHDRLYGSRFQRNLHLAETNPRIIGLSETAYEQTLVLDGFRETMEVVIGFFDGATVVYPLNETGASLYSQNKLPPHSFSREHLIDGQSFRSASATFIGAAIHLPSIRDLMVAVELDDRDGFKPFQEPAGICDAIGERVVEFSPEVGFHLADGLPSLYPTEGDRLPLVVSAISGKGHGELTLMRLGFIRDGRSIDNASKDRRWVFDLNVLLSENLTLERRIHLLNSWRWFLKHWRGDDQLCKEIEVGIQQIVGQQ